MFFLERSVIAMLSKSQVNRHYLFLQQVFEAKSTKKVRQLIAKANHLQLRTLFLLLTSVALKQLPASEKVKDAFFKSRKKRLLVQVSRSKAQVRRFLASSSTAEWRRVLQDLAPLLQPSLSVLFLPKPT